jgi:hypothetical protein
MMMMMMMMMIYLFSLYAVDKYGFTVNPFAHQELGGHIPGTPGSEFYSCGCHCA